MMHKILATILILALFPGAGFSDEPSPENFQKTPQSEKSNTSRMELDPLFKYKLEIAFQVERNWSFSQQVAGNAKNLETRVVFRVLPSGEITDVTFTKRSGSSYLDESVYKALIKANPVSPHPAGVKFPYVTVALRFSPQDL